jgi:tetratricopeptide (TPR) repeat protein
VNYHLLYHEDALKDFEQAIGMDNTNPENYYNRGNLYLHSENFKQAHSDFDRAIQLDNTNSKMYHAKGLAF